MKDPLKTSICYAPDFNEPKFKETYLSSDPVTKNQDVLSKQTQEMEAGFSSRSIAWP